MLHSFFLPQLRIKQDAVPGLTIPVRFDASKAGRYELLCAELCGWGHYKMRADVTVHETQSEFDEWMEQALREQDRSQPPGGPPTAAAPDVAAAPGTAWSNEAAMSTEHHAPGHGNGHEHGAGPDTGMAPGHIPSSGQAPGHDEHIHAGADEPAVPLRLLDRPQDHRHPVPLLRA